MTKLYTLQECFEANGSKFPFVVDWHNTCLPELPVVKNIVIIGYYKGQKDSFEHAPFFGGAKYFGEVSISREFDYSTPRYRIDFEEMLNND